MASPEALMIIKKMKGGSADGEKDPEEEAEDKGDVSAEAVTAAVESVFKALRGREPSKDESDALEEALDDYCTAKGY